MSEEMKNLEKSVCVNIENYTGEKPVEVIIRKGEAARAADPLPTKAPIKTNVKGVISTPFDWLEKRVKTIDQLKSHIFVDREAMSITLIVNEDDEYNRGTIVGTVEFTEIFKSLLKNFTANAKSQVEKQRDPSGSRADVYRQEVESNLPKSFDLNLAIFKGTPKVTVTVEFDHYLSDGDCLLLLVSPGANEAVEDFRDKCIDDVLDQIRKIAPEISIMEN